MHTICLVMAVADADSGVGHQGLKSALRSVKNHIDHWLIADLGMSHHAEQIITEELQDIAGEVLDVDEPNLAPVLTALLEMSRGLTSHTLVWQSDQTLIENPSARATKGLQDCPLEQRISADAHRIATAGKIRKQALCLINNAFHWRANGRFNPELACLDGTPTTSVLDDLLVSTLVDPQLERNRQETECSLAKQLSESSTEDGEACFYFAKRSMQLGHYQQAISAFESFLSLSADSNSEQHWYARLHHSKLLEVSADTDEIDPLVVNGYQAALALRPQRAEAAYNLARYYRERGQPQLAHVYARQAFDTRVSEHEHYDLELDVYRWHIPNELLHSSQAVNRHDLAVRAGNRALRDAQQSKPLLRAMQAARHRSYLSLLPPRGTKHSENRFRLVVPYRNAEQWLPACIRSIQSQVYPNFTATFIDDCSSDESASLIPKDDPRFELIQNSQRVGPLVNRMRFINACDAADIVLYLDGDDQLAADDVLSYLNTVYNEHNCWLSYGQYVTQHGKLGNAQPYASQSDLDLELNAGTMRFPIHPITHRAGLFHKLAEYDPDWTSFKDDAGDWLFWASDAVLARPLFYMAGINRIRYLERALYLYTEGHEISESIKNKQDQIETCRVANQRLRPPIIHRIV